MDTTLLLVAVVALGCGGAQHASPTEDGEPTTTEPTSGSDDRAIADYRTRGLFIRADSPHAADALANALVEVTVAVKVDADDTRPIYPAEELHSGDQLYVTVDAREPVYVYIMYVNPSNEASLLYPPQGTPDHRVEPGQPVRFPPEGAIELDDHTGVEQLYVIATREPLSDSGGDTLAAVDAVRQGLATPAYDAPENDEGPEPPPAAGGDVDLSALKPKVRMRGMSVVTNTDAVVATPDDDGVAVVYFPIMHEP